MYTLYFHKKYKHYFLSFLVAFFVLLTDEDLYLPNSFLAITRNLSTIVILSKHSTLTFFLWYLFL